MNKKFFRNVIITASLLLTAFSGDIVQAQGKKNTYTCINNKGVPTTVVDTPRGRIQLIVWKSDFFRNSGWTPQKRCEQVTARFQKFSDNGSLKYVTTGTVDQKYKVICVGKKSPGQGYSCIKDGILITLQPNDKPDEVLKNLFSNAAKVGGSPISRGQFAISMDKVLDESEVLQHTTEAVQDPLTIDNNNTELEKPTGINNNECPSILCD